MARVTPQEYAEKWGRRLKGSTEDIRRGVDRVTESPGAAAVRAQDLMIQRLMESIQNGTWAAQLSKMTAEDWKQALKTKGLGRIAAGVDAAQASQVDMAQQLLAAVDAASSKANALPKGTLEDSIARMTTFVREMAARSPRRPRR
jgi:hypothetical protein